MRPLRIPELSLPFRFALILLLILFLQKGDCQDIAEENLWEEVLGAPDYISQIEKLQDYVREFCNSNDNRGVYCSEASIRLDKLKDDYFEYSLQKSNRSTDLSRRIEDLKILYLDYPSERYGRRVKRRLNQLEDDLWDELSMDSSKWNQDGYENYLSLFPDGKYSDLATSNLQFLDASESLDPNQFYELYVSGKGTDRLHFFTNRYPDHQKVSEAVSEAVRIEEQIWQDVLVKNTSDDYERYQRWYPSGKYFDQAMDLMDALDIEDIQPVKGQEEIAWEAIQNTNDPAILRDYIAKFPKGDFNDEARKTLIVLDEAWFQEASELGTRAAYQSYLQAFPDGAFILEASNLIPELSNTDEDILWSQLMNNPSVEGFQAYLNQYTNGKYRKIAFDRIENLSPSFYKITHDRERHIVQFYNVKELQVIAYDEELVIDTSMLRSKLQLNVIPFNFGFYSILLHDEMGRELKIQWNRDINILFFQESQDSVSILINGGYEPYSLNLQDTSLQLTGARIQLPGQFGTNLIHFSKDSLRTVAGPGHFHVLIKDFSKKQIQQAGMITLPRSWNLVMRTVGIAFLGIILAMSGWTILNKKINKSQSKYDDADFQKDWENLD